MEVSKTIEAHCPHCGKTFEEEVTIEFDGTDFPD